MLSPGDIHRRIAEHLVQALANPTVDGAWLQSRFGYDQFPNVDSLDLEHHGFAIGMPSSLPDDADRQRNHHVRTTTAVRIRWGHRLRSDAAVLDGLDALAAEGELSAAVRRTDGNPALHIDVTDWQRQTTRDGLFFLGELGLRVVHLYPI